MAVDVVGAGLGVVWNEARSLAWPESIMSRSHVLCVPEGSADWTVTGGFSRPGCAGAGGWERATGRGNPASRIVQPIATPRRMEPP